MTPTEGRVGHRRQVRLWKDFRRVWTGYPVSRRFPGPGQENLVRVIAWVTGWAISAAAIIRDVKSNE